MVAGGTVGVVAGTVVVVVTVVVTGGVVVDVVEPVGARTGASDSPNVAGSDVSPIGWETRLLARYVIPATRISPARANATTRLRRERPMIARLSVLG